MNTEDKPKPGPQPATGPTRSDDAWMLDHHLDELLAALGAGGPLGQPAPVDASA
jgi:hypothetical protein